MTSARGAALAASLVIAVSGLAAAALSPAAAAEATWRSEEPTPAGSSWPIGLGNVGDIEFWAPNRGLLITAGDPPTIPPGLWAYNGVEWHPLATVCGATDGRIAWAGPEEFWAVSDGRAGQAGESSGNLERLAPLQDNTLCHFAGGQVAGSYAHPAFQADSYQAMRAAACLGPSDCWFAGDPLEEPQIGAFHLHWSGGSLEAEPYPGEGHAVEDMRALAGHLYESVRIASGDRVAVEEARAPVVHRINPAEAAPKVVPTFEPEDENGEGLPLYAPTELARGLDFLHLSAADGALWGAASRKYSEPEEAGHKPGQVTVAIREGGTWTQVVGPEHPLGPIFPPEQSKEEEQFKLGAQEKGEAKNAVVTAVAAEPGTNSAWIGLKGAHGSAATARAVLVRVSSEGHVLEEQTLPSSREQEEGVGPKGAAAKIACPAPNDCWLATAQGWLFHLAPEGERTLPKDQDPNFAGLITFRPADQGLPQVPPDAPPSDDSGLVEEPPNYGTFAESHASVESKVTLPLLSHLRSRLVNGSTLELRFHLAVKARVRLIAERRRQVVAATPMHTLKAGGRKLLLRLNPRRWPTKLNLQTHALAPLPLVSQVTGEGSNVSTETTGLFVLPRTRLSSGLGLLP
ncbi:MAG TPA: hypothetical protein VES65_10690 [Solirubrobacteraceae bacterium]|nr:hypothetical protein [Solirubrobacteraceae bacterium]